jgi:hypothetical protein
MQLACEERKGNVFGGEMSAVQDGSSAADYSAVDSREEAWRLVEQGDLVAILMLPEMFGGEERDENIVFVPEAIAARKDQIDEQIILPLIQAGAVVNYSVTPSYAGKAMVPVALTITATSPEPHLYSLQIWKPRAPAG